MAVVCSRCTKVFDSVDGCPRCGPVVSVPVQSRGPGHGPRWQQTTFGRILIGMVLAQGLFYGLRHLFSGVLLAVHETGDADLWGDPRNVYLLNSILGFAVLVGGMIAGGGQHYGLALGVFTGVWNGVMVSLLKQHPASEIAGLGFFSQPLLQGAIGAVGGLIGSLIWKPITASAGGGAPALQKLVPRSGPLLGGAVAWVRVLLGSAAVVAGSLFAARLFQKILDLGGKDFGTTDDFQDVFITWQIRALLVLLGAAFAGASTWNGFKQGLFVGIIASAVLVGIQAPVAKKLPQTLGITVGTTLGLSMLGGWFGGQLLPPLLRGPRRGRANGAPAW
jgi:hypothetical protein